VFVNILLEGNPNNSTLITGHSFGKIKEREERALSYRAKALDFSPSDGGERLPRLFAQPQSPRHEQHAFRYVLSITGHVTGSRYPGLRFDYACPRNHSAALEGDYCGGFSLTEEPISSPGQITD
jgi:hypothetical protein